MNSTLSRINTELQTVVKQVIEKVEEANALMKNSKSYAVYHRFE